jgi:hypothetical protein
MNKIYLMKHTIIAILMSILLVNVQGQGLKVGLKGGANISGLSGLAFKDGFQFGYHAGLFVELMVTEKFGIQPEFLFSETNLRVASAFSSLYTNFLPNITDVKLKYISIPVLLNFKPIKLVTLQAGPQFGILRDNTRSITTNATEAFKKGDLAVVAGVQLNLPIVRLYGRYVAGITNINEIDNSDTWRNAGLQLGAAISF